ncbi:hypothetical protein D3C84_1220810 [compost metagenome]
MPKNNSLTPHSTPMPRIAATTQPPKFSGRMPATGRVNRKKLAENANKLFGRRIHGPLDRRAGGLRRRRYTKIAPTNITTVINNSA